MQRVFTRAVGRFKAGEIKDYPSAVWREIARSARLTLDKFTSPVDVELKRIGQREAQRSTA